MQLISFFSCYVFSDMRIPAVLLGSYPERSDLVWWPHLQASPGPDSSGGCGVDVLIILGHVGFGVERLGDDMGLTSKD